MNILHTVEVTIGDGVVTMRPRSSSTTRVARILAQEIGSDDTETLWLDRLVHHPKDELTHGWIASGAISTILCRSRPPAPETEPSQRSELPM